MGPHSCPAFADSFLKNDTEKAQAALIPGQRTVSVFGLANSNVTYPFVSLWSAGGGIEYVQSVLPSDATCMR